MQRSRHALDAYQLDVCYYSCIDSLLTSWSAGGPADTMESLRAS